MTPPNEKDNLDEWAAICSIFMNDRHLDCRSLQDPSYQVFVTVHGGRVRRYPCAR